MYIYACVRVCVYTHMHTRTHVHVYVLIHYTGSTQLYVCINRTAGITNKEKKKHKVQVR